MVLRATCDNIAEKFEQEFVITAENGVEIGGLITEDLTLYPNVHYIVTSNLGVASGVTLTIKPGTILRFKDNISLSMADGSHLIANGTPDSMIVFTSPDSETSYIPNILLKDTIRYAKFTNYRTGDLNARGCLYIDCVFENIERCHNVSAPDFYFAFKRCNMSSNVLSGSGLLSEESYGLYCNAIGNRSEFHEHGFYKNDFYDSNIYGNLDVGDKSFTVSYSSSTPSEFILHHNYYGSPNESKIREYGVYDMLSNTGFGLLNFSNVAKAPIAETHGVVWKVVVNGYDAQDEFEQLPPLGIGRHKFEVYFNRPMNKEVVPFIAMGVRPPYTSHSIAEDGSWNEEGTIYTAYLTITGKTGADGLNRIYVSSAEESLEDYYTRKELRKISQKTKSLLQNVTNVHGKVNLQVSDKSQEGYLASGFSENVDLFFLFDERIDECYWLHSEDWLQVDLGESKNARLIRFKCHFGKSGEWSDAPNIVKIKGSNDGMVFYDICAFPSSDDNRNPLPLVFENSIGNPYPWESSVIDAGDTYRYYRIVFSDNKQMCISEFGMEVLDPILKDGYATLLSEEEVFEIQRYLEFIDDLCRDEKRDNNLLQYTLNQTYVNYNKLAEILGEELMEQQPIEVPSAPMWVVPVENTRFNVEVAATGSMATGLMAEAGLGKVTLTWETDEEDFEDLLGYNIYRYTEVDDSAKVKDYDKYGDYQYHWEYFIRRDSIIINPSVLEAEETSFVDYDVVPGTTYYYVIKQLTTSLNSHALSNAVAATPLTAKKGDANGSMNVDIADVVTEVAYITYQDPQPFIFEAADVNSDQKVNVLDVVGTIGIITTPAEIGVSGIDNEPVRYYVQDGVLYMENTQPLGGVQVRLGVAKGTAITALEALAGMERTSVWTSDSEYLFLAYSMSGRSIPAGTHALLQIGSEAVVTEMVLSDTKGKNITAVNGNTTGIGKVEAVQLQMPSPNPFTTVLHVPYTIGKSGSHEVTIAFSDMAGRIIDAYHTVNTPGEYTYTWYPKALAKGLYLVSLYLDGELMQTVKVVRE